MYADSFDRTALLLGAEAMDRLQGASVCLFGVGGVGSWCAEALVRSGVGQLTIVDSDCVDATNINRQLPATVATIGRPKVDVMRERLLQINPDVDIVALCQRYTADTAESFNLMQYNCVVDAIDSLQDKMNLILECTRKSDSTLAFFSSMGAARKMDPTQVQVSEFWKVDGCPLAATLRKRMRRQLRFPERKFKCVWSAERCDEAQPNGTMMPVTATFGLVLASLVLQHLVRQR